MQDIYRYSVRHLCFKFIYQKEHFGQSVARLGFSTHMEAQIIGIVRDIQRVIFKVVPEPKRIAIGIHELLP